MARILVLYYSAIGHTENMAMAVAHGARSIEGTEVALRRVPGLLRADGSTEGSLSRKIPLAEPWELAEYDGILFGGPTRMGAMCTEMHIFMEQTLPLWHERALVGKVGGVFVTSATQHGGHEASVLGFHQILLYHGMIVTGIPFTEEGLTKTDAVSGGSPWGAGTISGRENNRPSTDNEFDLAEALGARVAAIASRLFDE